MNWRVRRMGLSTLFGWRKRGWFIPYRYAGTLPAAGARPPYPAIASLLEGREPAFLDLLAAIDGHRAALLEIGAAPPPAPRWRQSWFPLLDAAAAYTRCRRHRPSRIVEVGSGHSTRFLARAVQDGGIDCRVTAIDPAPRARIDGLPIEIVRGTLTEAGEAPFAALRAGDVLFIDSSHILMPGSDVDFLLGRVLPVLPSGVLVHIHDIFLPDDYPAAWDWRGYNEQQGVIALLQGGAYEVTFASHYVATRLGGELGRGVLKELPLENEAFEASLWLRKL